MAWLPDGEKLGLFIRFDTTHERDRYTDRHTHIHTDTQTPHDGIGRAYASHRAAKIAKTYVYRAGGPLSIAVRILHDKYKENDSALQCVVG